MFEQVVTMLRAISFSSLLGIKELIKLVVVATLINNVNLKYSGQRGLVLYLVLCLFNSFLPVGDLIPHYYYVPKIYMEAERKQPHSQIRLPSDEDGDLFMWGQALLIIMQLIGTRMQKKNDCSTPDVKLYFLQ